MTGMPTPGRIERLLEKLSETGVDCLLVGWGPDLRYLTGFTGSNGLALVGRDERLFVTDFRYVEQAGEEVDPSFERAQASGELLPWVAQRLSEAGPLRLGFDDSNLSVRAYEQLRELAPEGVEPVAAGGLVAELRMVKEAGEVELIAAAARVADEAFEEVVGSGVVGRTERELALALEVEMRLRGASGPSFSPIVAAGAHGALPHAEPRDMGVEEGQLVVFDWGAVVDGYCSDCTRTVAAGEVSGEAREVYELVRSAQQVGLEAVRAGADGVEVDRAVREVIASAGYGERFGHGLGHGVGLEPHERPRLSPRSEDVLQAGNVVTVEPGVYLTGRFGVRIEDLLVVTENGCEVLTGLDRTLRVVA
jgi:Xaa-Pro aminopeptidase